MRQELLDKLTKEGYTIRQHGERFIRATKGDDTKEYWFDENGKLGYIRDRFPIYFSK